MRFQNDFTGHMPWKRLLVLLIATHQVKAQDFILPNAYPYPPGALRRVLGVVFSCSLRQLRQGRSVVHDRRSGNDLQRQFPTGARRMRSAAANSCTNH